MCGSFRRTTDGARPGVVAIVDAASRVGRHPGADAKVQNQALMWVRRAHNALVRDVAVGACHRRKRATLRTLRALAALEGGLNEAVALPGPPSRRTPCQGASRKPHSHGTSETSFWMTRGYSIESSLGSLRSNSCGPSRQTTRVHAQQPRKRSCVLVKLWQQAAVRATRPDSPWRVGL